MKDDVKRNLGIQPLSVIMEKYNLTSHDIVAASTEQITHKMVSRAIKGRKLTRRIQEKILRAVNAAASAEHALKDLFHY